MKATTMRNPNHEGLLAARITGICTIIAGIGAALIAAWVAVALHNESTGSGSATANSSKQPPIPSSQQASQTPNKLYILTGQIRDAKDSSRIGAADVTVKWNGAIEVARTDNMGVYKLVLNNPPDNFTIDVDATGYKSVVDENHSIKIENGGDTWNKMLTAIAATAPTSPNPNLSHIMKNFSVSGRCGLISANGFATGLTIGTGDYIAVTAADEISVGPNIGSTGPDGVNFIKVPLLGPQPINPGYYMLSEIGLGGLLWRIGTSGSWHPCGSAKEWTAKTSGQLYFNVNDRIQSDNSGEFTVSVDVAHHKG